MPDPRLLRSRSSRPSTLAYPSCPRPGSILIQPLRSSKVPGALRLAPNTPRDTSLRRVGVGEHLVTLISIYQGTQGLEENQFLGMADTP